MPRQYWPQFTKWAEYLRDKGLDPANQLSTDDFAGHLAHNANLSIKAIEGLAAYAQMARGVGKPEVAAEYSQLAAGDGGQVANHGAIDGDHYKLAFDKPGTWSQKYNLVWDRILDLQSLSRPRSARPRSPSISSTSTSTACPWTTAPTTPSSTGRSGRRRWPMPQPGAGRLRALMAPIGRWINEGPTRVPLTDWYDTKTGKQMGFQARSVVGGVYIKALADRTLAAKWRNRVEP